MMDVQIRGSGDPKKQEVSQIWGGKGKNPGGLNGGVSICTESFRKVGI
jgi:hypothetical protein